MAKEGPSGKGTYEQAVMIKGKPYRQLEKACYAKGIAHAKALR
jgi:hypothetical protein